MRVPLDLADAQLLGDLQRITLKFQGLLVVAELRVRRADALQAARRSRTVPDPLTHLERSTVVVQGLAVLAPGLVDQADVDQGEREIGLIADTLVDGSGPL